jgi:hypothetical protein
MADDYVTVSWFEHDCEWVSKYCYEHHEVHARVPVDVLTQYTSKEK